MKYVKRAQPIVILAVLAAIAALAGVAGPRVASADGAASEALLHKVFIDGVGFSIINPAPGEEASGSIAFDADNAATVTINPYITSSSICAWPAQPEASVAFDREDSVPGITFDELLHFANGCASPVDFNVQTGSNDVTITVTAPDGVTINTYLITIIVPPRPAAPDVASWAEDPVTREHTFMTPETNGRVATGFTSATGNADEFWIASQKWWDWLNGHRTTVSLYDRATGEVDNGAGFNLGPTNGRPSTFKIGPGGSWVEPELWYGNGILWMTVEIRSNQFVMPFQRTESGWTLLSDKRIRLTHYDHIRERWQYSPGDIWSDGETMWVSGYYSRVYAYNMATRARDTSKEFGVPDVGKRPFLRIHTGTPGGLWSDGTTMWVEDIYHRKVYAFDLQTKARLPGLDFDIVRAPQAGWSNRLWQSGMWSDGNIIWLKQGRYSVAYNLPGTPLPPTQSPPQFTSLYAVKLPGDAGDVPELITVTATDADDDPIAYAKAGDWPAQFGIGSGSGIISYTRGDGPPIAQGEYELTVTADDGHGGTAETTVLVIVSAPSGICDRTEQVRDAIIAKLNEGLDTPEVTDCAAVTAEYLSGITGELELSKEEIPALKSGDFDGISNLNSLQMIDSGLETLPEDIFDGLTALHSLFIIGNDDLGALPENIFDGLTGLTNLHVSGNEALSELPEGIFDGLTSLGFLHLAENSLTTLPEDIFDGLTGLQLLHLQNNQLTELPSGIFDGLGSLKYILLNGNSLRALPADVFEGLSSLTQLPLEGNNLESLPDGLFGGLVSLEQVLLSSNEGAPFTLTAELEQRGDGAFVVKVVEGSPFDLTVTLSARGGTLSSTTVTVEAGSLASGPVSVSVDGSGPAQVKVTVESATFPEDREHSGIDTGLSQPLVLEIPGDPPAETVQLTAPASVTQNTEATVTMSFANLESDSDTSDTDYIFRADVKDGENGNADACEGGGMGNDRYMYKVDEDLEVRAATISAACPPGDYTVQVSISSPADLELASATVDFTVDAPVEQQQAQEPPPSTDATLSGLMLSDVPFTFASDTTRYDVNVANGVDETTVTPTLNDDGATYTIKLGGVADADGVIPLAVGSNVITVEVTAEDGNATRTYTVTVTRAASSASGPAVAIALSPSGPVEEGTEVTVTMSFGGLEQDSDPSDVDYIFRADVKNSANGNADSCEDQKGGYGLGVERYMKQVDENPEVRTGTVSASCAPGDYTVEVSISSPGNVELASAHADFTVNAPGQEQQPEPPSTDATLRGLALSDVTLAFASGNTEYTANVANDVDETTVTPTTNHDEATYAIKLGGVTDADGVIPLAAGSNVITIDVTAEDGNTAKTYTVTVTRDAPSPSADATLSNLTLSDAPFTFASDTTSYDVNVANGVDQTTVTPTVNDDGASYGIKLGGVTDADGVIPLAVGRNAIIIEVTAEDGETTKTYTVTVNRDAPPESVEPEPESTGERSAWLESNPENQPFVGEWQHFTLRGSGLDKVDLQVNVIGFGGEPGSTGAVGYATASPPPAVGEVCESADYSGYQMSVDATFSLVGCREGTVVIELLDPGNNWALLKRYAVAVNAEP